MFSAPDASMDSPLANAGEQRQPSGGAATPLPPFLPPQPAFDRPHFLRLYAIFCNLTGHAYNEMINVRRFDLDIHELWTAVRQQGGYNTVCVRKLWATTARRFAHPPTWTNASYYFRLAYESAGLNRMEEMLESGQIPVGAAPAGSGTRSAAPAQPQPDEQQQQQQQQQQQGQWIAAAPEHMDWSQIVASQQQQQPPVHNPTMPALDMSLLTAEEEAAAAAAAVAAAVAAVAGAGANAATTNNNHSSSSSLLQPGVAGVAAATSGSNTAERPSLVAIACGTVRGVFDVHRQRIFCRCDACVTAAGDVGGLEMTPTEFERHGGCALRKKWKKSITVRGTRRNLGAWLKAHGIEVLSRSAQTKRARLHAPAPTPAAAAAAALAGGGRSAGGDEVGAGGGRVYPQGMFAAAAAAAVTGAGQHMPPQQHSNEPQLMMVLQQHERYQRHEQYHHHQQQQQYQQQQQQQSQYQMLQAPSFKPLSELPPSNNLAGMEGFMAGQLHNTGPLAVTPAAAAAGGGGVGGDVCMSDTIMMLQLPAGDALVGCSIELWCDNAWFEASVQAYDPLSGLHLLCFESDGELETLDLQDEQWRLSAHAQQQQQQHRQEPQAGSMLAAEDSSSEQGLTLTGSAGQQSAAAAPDELNAAAAAAAAAADDAAWWEAAQRSAQDRPLRVVFDSSSGHLMVLTAGQLLEAELHMRQQRRLEHQQQRQQEPEHAGPAAPVDPAAAAAAAAAAAVDPSAASTQPSLPLAASLPPVELSTNPAVFPNQPLLQVDPMEWTAAAADASQQFAGGIGSSPLAFLPAMNSPQAEAFNVAAAAAAAAAGLTTTGAAAAGVQVVAAESDVVSSDTSVEVVCGSKLGRYLAKSQLVVCYCGCTQRTAATGGYVTMSAHEFERHAGLGRHKKWRNSIKVRVAGATTPSKGGEAKQMSLGTWLMHQQQQRMQQEMAKIQQAVLDHQALLQREEEEQAVMLHQQQQQQREEAWAMLQQQQQQQQGEMELQAALMGHVGAGDAMMWQDPGAAAAAGGGGGVQFGAPPLLMPPEGVPGSSTGFQFPVNQLQQLGPWAPPQQQHDCMAADMLAGFMQPHSGAENNCLASQQQQLLQGEAPAMQPPLPHDGSADAGGDAMCWAPGVGSAAAAAGWSDEQGGGGGSCSGRGGFMALLQEEAETEDGPDGS